MPPDRSRNVIPPKRYRLALGGLALLLTAAAAVLEIRPAYAAEPAVEGSGSMDMNAMPAGVMAGSAPAGLLFGRMMPAGSAMLMYMPAFMGMDGNLVGTTRVSPQTIVTTVPAFNAMPSMGAMGGAAQKVRIVPTDMSAQMQMLGGLYAVTDTLNLAVTTSWLHQSMTMTTFAGMMGSTVLGKSSDSTSGFGDTSVAALVRLYQDATNHVHLSAGLSLPTGSNTETVTMLSPMNAPMTMRAPYGMQLGTGTVDALLGLTYTGGRDRVSWGAAWRLRLPLDDNSEGYKFGAVNEETGWAGYEILPGIVTTLRAAFTQQGHIDGHDPQIIGLAETADPSFYGGTRLSLLGGVEIKGDRFGLHGFGLSVEAGAPVYQNLNGPQLSRDWQVGVALTYRL